MPEPANSEIVPFIDWDADDHTRKVPAEWFDYTVRRDDHGEARIHRTWVKMGANPILRLFGWHLVSVFEHGCFIGYLLRRLP